MKNLLFTVALAATLVETVRGQGILIDNTLNINPNPAAPTSGLVWTNVNGQLGLFDGFNNNLGIEIYAGPSADHLSYLGTLYPGDTNGTAYTGFDYGYLQQWPSSAAYE